VEHNEQGGTAKGPCILVKKVHFRVFVAVFYLKTTTKNAKSTDKTVSAFLSFLMLK